MTGLLRLLKKGMDVALEITKYLLSHRIHLWVGSEILDVGTAVAGNDRRHGLLREVDIGETMGCTCQVTGDAAAC